MLLLAGCGYHFSGTGINLPEGVSQLKIELFNNQTTEPYLETVLTDMLSFRLMRQHNIELVEDAESADAVLTGAIQQYDISASAFDTLDKVRAYRVTMKISARLKRVTDGKILWQGVIIRFEDFANGSVTITAEEDLEATMQRKVSARIAEEISWQMATGFGADK